MKIKNRSLILISLLLLLLIAIPSCFAMDNTSLADDSSFISDELIVNDNGTAQLTFALGNNTLNNTLNTTSNDTENATGQIY